MCHYRHRSRIIYSKNPKFQDTQNLAICIITLDLEMNLPYDTELPPNHADRMENGAELNRRTNNAAFDWLIADNFFKIIHLG